MKTKLDAKIGHRIFLLKGRTNELMGQPSWTRPNPTMRNVKQHLIKYVYKEKL